MWRSFDVGAVVESLPFTTARVVGGAGGMGRSGSRARLAGSPDRLRHVAAGELVVTTVATLADTGEECPELVARLDAARIAGVAIRLEAAEQVPPTLLEAADRL